MKKIIFLTLTLFPLWGLGELYAQKEVWGTTARAGSAVPQGIIAKYDINGENAVNMHLFNYPTGKVPEGKLLLASNGKLYGTATYGGINGTTPNNDSDGYGVLYEYDLTFDTYRVVHYFTGTLASPAYPTSGLIEPVPGKLYGGNMGGGFFVYDIATETASFLNHTYSFVAMGAIYGDLIKASNGFVYAISNQSFACNSFTGPNDANQGSVIKINTTTNTAQRVTVFNCDLTTGIAQVSTIVEALPNRLFFTSQGSLIFFPDGTILPAGTILEYNTLTNVLSTRVSFNFTDSLGYGPRSLVLNTNGTLYGVCEAGGDTYKFAEPQTMFNKTGTIFEYNPTTNAITKLRDIDASRYDPYNLIKLSTGDYMGNFSIYGLFKYKPDTNALVLPDLNSYNGPDQTRTQNLIEICRKPAYQQIVVNAFDVCVGSTFTYNIQNTNATTYVWKKGTTVLPLQTTAILNLTNITVADAGAYTCVMTNECGTTTTMPLNLTVNCLGTNTVATLDNAVKLYPNPAKEWLNIDLPTNIDVIITSCAITNLLGQTVTKTIANNKIDVSHLQQGVYIVSLETNYGRWNGKFVKE